MKTKLKPSMKIKNANHKKTVLPPLYNGQSYFKMR